MDDSSEKTPYLLDERARRIPGYPLDVQEAWGEPLGEKLSQTDVQLLEQSGLEVCVAALSGETLGVARHAGITSYVTKETHYWGCRAGGISWRSTLLKRHITGAVERRGFHGGVRY